MKKGKVSLSVGYVTCNDRADFMAIRISDDTSNVMLVEVEVPLDKFTQILTSHFVGSLDAEFGDLSLIGKQHEFKTEWVIFDRNDFLLLINNVNKLEKNGWQSEITSDEINGRLNHHRIKENKYQVGFRRYLDVKE
jgi:hypothetical protein